jgi:predicted ATP-grasp superfamily ATP-dependent carboligase
LRVLVLDGNENQAVACARSLARAGHDVEVGADTSWSKAGLSRSCRSTFTYPAPHRDQSAFVHRIADVAARVPGTFVLPMTERATLPLSAARHLLHAVEARYVLPSHDTVLTAFDKVQTSTLAESLGLTVPWTAIVESGQAAARIAPDLPYPVVLKPSSSEETVATGTRTTGAPVYVNDPGAFITACAEMLTRCRCALVQEFVAGSGVGYFALTQRGELRAEFAHRRLRDVRPTGSGSSLRVSAPVDARLRAAGLAVLQALQWDGVAMVEFRQRPDGSLVFLEVNGRFWNSLALAVHAGVDFPALLAQVAERGDVAQQTGYRAGVRCRWLLGDARHLAAVWKGAPHGYPGTFPGRLRTLRDFLRPVAGTFHDNFSFSDPLPELGDWLDFFARRVPAHLARTHVTTGGR